MEAIPQDMTRASRRMDTREKAVPREETSVENDDRG